MKKPTLAAQAHKFGQNLKALKQRTSLNGGMHWYPWDSLAAMHVLDTFLGGDAEALREMIGGGCVLDAGCGDGDVAFFLESFLGETPPAEPGRARVDAIDHAPTNYNGMAGVRTLKRALNSSVDLHAVDLDTRPHLPGSNYGLTIMLGVLYHLKNPFLVLETLARHSRHIFLSTRIASRTPDHKLDFGSLPMAYLVDEDELNHDSTNFWIFSEEGLKRIVRRAGWNVRRCMSTGGSASSADPVTPQGDVRAYILAESRLSARESGLRLEHGWHDLEYDAWRWTERRFSVFAELAAPLPEPATLRFLFQLPPQALSQRPAVTLQATVNGVRLSPVTFSTPGGHEYEATLPALAAGTARVEFELDRALGPSETDQRELGVLVDFSGAPPLQWS
jgi:tRNA (mo5U34)-methyltransferase